MEPARIRVETIRPKSEFSFIRLPERLPGGHLSERAQLLENFDFVPSTGGAVNPLPRETDDVLFYKLLLSPSNPPEGRDSADWVDVLGVDGFQERVNEIAGDVVEMSRQSSGSPSIDATTVRKEWGQYLNVMYVYISPLGPRLTFSRAAAD